MNSENIKINWIFMIIEIVDFYIWVNIHFTSKNLTNNKLSNLLFKAS